MIDTFGLQLAFSREHSRHPGFFEPWTHGTYFNLLGLTLLLAGLYVLAVRRSLPVAGKVLVVMSPFVVGLVGSVYLMNLYVSKLAGDSRMFDWEMNVPGASLVGSLYPSYIGLGFSIILLAAWATVAVWNATFTRFPAGLKTGLPVSS